jgi:DNA-binding response OmpR family regulator
MAQRVLIVEDETSVAEAVAYALEKEGFEAFVAADGASALQWFEARSPDLVILDLMLPGLSGWQLLPIFRGRREVPVIMLTARSEETDRVAGLEMGADDYITKPFAMRELVARVRAVLRRADAAKGGDRPRILLKGRITLDAERREVCVKGEPVQLTPKEFDVLAYLMKHAGRPLTREEIYRAVWGEEFYPEDRTVDVHVHWLRRKIEENPTDPQCLVTVARVGYKFVEAP